MDYDYYYNLVFTSVTLQEYTNKTNTTTCVDCSVERIHVDHNTICPECGHVVESLEVFVTDYRKTNTPYKRLTYFSELLQKLQGKIMTELPKELLPKLEKEILKNLCVWTIITLRKVLKKLGYSKFYPDSVYIFSLLFPKKEIPKLSPQQESYMVSSFLKIQGNWDKVKPKKRKTMLSNPYIIKKLSQLGNMSSVGDWLGFPKDVRKLIEYDIIWQKLCILFNWKFYPSF